jgi:BirA family biotin operon repressor/biotin-[acetyl-CoA-carboxylase] ligase
MYILDAELNVQGPSRLNIDVLQRQLGTQFVGVGNRLFYLPIVESTNTFAMQLAQKRPEEGMVVLTDSQTAGKGRLGRRWIDVSGCNVLSSTVLRPLFPPHLLVMIASLAVVDAIAETCGIVATIKWPNDVLIRERKVAGILIETSHDLEGRMVAVLGIGVNVNGRISEEAQSLATIATTLEIECGHVVSRETFLARMLEYIEKDYLALQREAGSSGETFSMTPTSSNSIRPIARLIRERWRDKLATLGRTVEVRQGSTILSGVAEDVDDDGELLLRSHSGEFVTITWGDVNHPTG